jgi:hypothetical protein
MIVEDEIKGTEVLEKPKPEICRGRSGRPPNVPQRHANQATHARYAGYRGELERATRLELATFSLGSRMHVHFS